MAGIGFELRKLLDRDDLIGIAEGYGHAALATSGPWLFTIVALSVILLVGGPAAPPEDLAAFRLIVVYNFSLTLVLTAPVAIVLTRYLADSIHAKNVEQAPAALLGGLLLTYAAAAPIGGFLYLWYAQLDRLARIAAFTDFLLIAGIWTVSVFLTALKDYRALTWSFGFGLAIGIVSAILLAGSWGAPGMLMGLNVGLAVTLFSLMARIFAEYPTRAQLPFAFLPYFRKYWELALAALAYNLAVWADKWIMWLAPEHQLLRMGFLSFPDYESATFLAYLSVVPSMAAFTVTIETGFFEKYARFYDDILRHVSYGRIESNHKDLIQSLMEGGRNFVVLAGSISFAGILLAPQIFESLGISFTQLGIFRLSLLGAFFHVGFLFLMVILTYFDLRRMVLAVACLFLGANCLFTLVTLKLGFAWYGYGYFLAALTAFSAAFLALGHFLQRLPYATFVRNNSSVVQ
ncbi:MAG: exopolysaccharide Pel transporter PelG [Acidobacteriia bacterium]|nr:exopolysaccharide Pel transporter PelG [Terriglobia bacterium]